MNWDEQTSEVRKPNRSYVSLKNVKLKINPMTRDANVRTNQKVCQKSRHTGTFCNKSFKKATCSNSNSYIGSTLSVDKTKTLSFVSLNSKLQLINRFKTKDKYKKTTNER